MLAANTTEDLVGLFFKVTPNCYFDLELGGKEVDYWRLTLRVSEFTVESRLDSSREDVGSFRLLVDELRIGRGQQGDIGEVGMKGRHCIVIEISFSPYQICKKR